MVSADGLPDGGAPATGEPTPLARAARSSVVSAALGIVSGFAFIAAVAVRYRATTASDAYFAGSLVPLGLAQIFLVVANQIFVPAFTPLAARSPNRLIRNTTATVLVLVSAVSVLGALVAPGVVRLVAPGLDGGARQAAIDCFRIMLIALPMLAIAELLRAAMNARYRYLLAGAARAVWNLVAAAFVVGLAHGATSIAWANTIGAAAQAVLLIVAAPLVLRDRPTGSGRAALAGDAGEAHGTAHLLRLSLLPSAGAALNPAARAMEQAFASTLAAGSISVLNYAMTSVTAVANGVFFRSIFVALLPGMRRARVARDDEETERQLRRGVSLMVALALALTVGLLLAAWPLARAVSLGDALQSGAARRAIAPLLAVLALSLVPSGLQRVQLNLFYAELDVRTPFINTVWGVGAEALVLPLFVLPLHDTRFALAAIGAAYTVGQIANVEHAERALRRRGFRSQLDRSTFAAVVWPLLATTLLILPQLVLVQALVDSLAVFTVLMLFIAVEGLVVGTLLYRHRKVRAPATRSVGSQTGVRGTTTRVARHARWLRTEGYRKLAAEDRIDPVGRWRGRRARRAWQRTEAPEPGTATLVLVVGAQRSGTNMVVNMLDRPWSMVFRESDRALFRDFVLRPLADVRPVIAGCRARAVVVNPLCDSHRTREMLDADLALASHALWVHRNVDDRVASAVAKFGDQNRRMIEAIADGSAGAAWYAQGITDDDHERCRDAVARGLTVADGSALFWYLRNRLLFTTGLTERHDVVVVSYDELVADPELVGAHVVESLGLPPDPAMFTHIHRGGYRAERVELSPPVRALCDELTDALGGLSRQAKRR